MVALFSLAGKLQFLMRSFKIKVKCGTSICLPSIIAQAGPLRGPVGLLGFKSLMESKQSFFDTAQKQKEALPAKKMELLVSICQKYPRFEKTYWKWLAFLYYRLSTVLTSLLRLWGYLNGDCASNAINKIPTVFRRAKGGKTLSGDWLLMSFITFTSFNRLLLKADQLSADAFWQYFL